MAFDLSKSMEGSASNFGSLGISRILVQIIQFFILAVITRNLGAELFGKMNVILMIAQFLYCLTASWTALGYTRFSMLYSNQGKPIGQVFWCRSFLVFILLLMTGFVLIIWRDWVMNYLKLQSPIIPVVFFFLLSLLATDYTTLVAQVTTRFKGLSIIQFIEKALVFIIICFFGRSLFEILWIYISVTLACRTAYLVMSPGNVFRPFALDRSLCIELLRFSGPLFLTSFGGFVFGWVDIAVIKKFAPLSDVGIYSLAYNGLSAIDSIVMIMSSILIPIFVSLAARNREDLTEKFIMRILPQVAYLWGLFFMVFGLISIWMIPLAFGQTFMESVDIFLILLVSLNLSVMNALMVPVFVGYNMVSRMVIINFSGSILNLLLDIVLVYYMGIMGAALATTLSYCFIVLFYNLLIRSRFHSAFRMSWLFLAIVFLHMISIMFCRVWFICVGVSLTVILIYLIAARTMKLFGQDDRSIYSSLDMPPFLKRMLIRMGDYAFWARQ
ncbi:MAG: oligosaccharide flippase family protein [Deltaproteobacteria bacterium]|nr:oligosaccharide flippase family protein [Deltaproteobacteria bacterium]